MRHWYVYPGALITVLSIWFTLVTATDDCSVGVEGGRWRQDCNWCSCMNGRGFCTKKGCLSSFLNRLKNLPECEGDISWKKDCNLCRCADGVADCENNDCVSGQSPPPESTDSLVKDETNVTELEKNCETFTDDGSFRKSCNWCRCTPSGLSFCTKRGCAPNYETRIQNEPNCKGQIRWKEGCNWCNCIEGKAICTSLECISEPMKRTELLVNATPEEESTKECEADEEGGRWRVACNWCRCGGGRGLCTRRACMPDFETRLGSVPECEGVVSWRKDCNWCRCSNGVALCSLKACSPIKSDNSVMSFGNKYQHGGSNSEACSEGNKWKDGCSTCWCLDGHTFCTLCSTDHDEVHHEPPQDDPSECSEGSRWKQECNWCTCMKGRSVCTLRACVPGFDISRGGPECEEGSNWKKDCNRCHCSNGRAICTLKGCFRKEVIKKESVESIEDEEKADETKKGGDFRKSGASKVVPQVDCTDGSRWKKDCNWCDCIQGRETCTEVTCSSGHMVQGPMCEEGSQWKKDECNWCSCTGGNMECTENLCAELRQEIPDDVVQCTEGSRWMKKCNWCNCFNGSALCTLKGCLDDDESLGVRCEGTSNWRNGCGWCNCVNGIGNCDEVPNCPSTLTAEPPIQSPCIDGEKWVKDCNTCTCTRGFPSCTEKLCHLDGRSPHCTEGDSWKNECNTCRCIEGMVACTQMLCESNLSVHPPVFCNHSAIHPEAERCSGFQMKWTYSSKTMSCEQIVYGGCGGTENLFRTKEECVTTCGPRDVTLNTGRSDPTKERCYLPLEPGPCFASQVRFAFIPERNRCEQFFYGGCLGNQNNFLMGEECHQICGGEAPVIDPSCDRSLCPWHKFGHYIAKECSPVYEGGQCCPTSFVCKSEEERGRSSDMCYYKGKAYAVEGSVPVEDPCSAGCRCVKGGTQRVAEINCASVECPSLFRPPEPGCRPLFREGSCCSYAKECDDPTAPPSLQPRGVTCIWKNETFKLGSKMYFAEDDCQVCICGPDFKDPYGPGCKRIQCGFEFRYRGKLAGGCTPVYFESRCCPIDWMCPGDPRLKPENLIGGKPVIEDLVTEDQCPPTHTHEEIPEDAICAHLCKSDTDCPSGEKCCANGCGGAICLERDNTSPGDASSQCLFGNVTFAVGFGPPVRDCILRCRCVVPPDLTCVQYRSCEGAPVGRSQDAKCPKVTCSGACTEKENPRTGCSECFCKDLKFRCPEVNCSICNDPEVVYNMTLGCPGCKCDAQSLEAPKVSCRIDPFTKKAPCPMDCVIRRRHDSETGCEVCDCDPNARSQHEKPVAVRCRVDLFTGKAPCPMDCKIKRHIDSETGCEICECDSQESKNFNDGH